MNSPTTDPLNFYQQILINAGFVPITSEVKIDNFLIYFLPWENHELSIKEPLPSQVLRPWENKASNSDSKISLFSFSYTECNLCGQELEAISHLQMATNASPSLQVFPVVCGTNATRIIADYVKPHIEYQTKIFLDLEDGLCERMSILHTPASRLIDENGKIIAYSNSSLDLGSSGFKKFLALTNDWNQIKSKHGYSSFSEALAAPDTETRVEYNKFSLDIRLMHYVLIGILVVVGYTILRSIKRHK